MGDYFIEGPHIGLRPVHCEDKELFLQWHNDEALRKQIGGPVPFSAGEFEEACRMNEKVNPPHVWFSICSDDRLIGITGLHQIRYIQRNAELSILIGSAGDRNRGWGTECIKLMERYAFRELHLHRIYAYVFDDNAPSEHLFRRCGWIREGLLREASWCDSKYRNEYLFARLEED